MTIEHDGQSSSSSRQSSRAWSVVVRELRAPRVSRARDLALAPVKLGSRSLTLLYSDSLPLSPYSNMSTDHLQYSHNHNFGEEEEDVLDDHTNFGVQTNQDYDHTLNYNDQESGELSLAVP